MNNPWLNYRDFLTQERIRRSSPLLARCRWAGILLLLVGTVYVLSRPVARDPFQTISEAHAGFAQPSEAGGDQ